MTYARNVKRQSDIPEKRRLHQARTGKANWRRWGPYIAERAWGSVREDYSQNSDAWSFTTHDMARSLAYRWGEDGIGGICDSDQVLCFAPAFWNGKDAILKERFFGLTNYQGNHGEDVKELYYHLDNTPTHSYMRMLYKYPQAAFPYELLVSENAHRGRNQREFEITDTGVFNAGNYFDITIEYAKALPEEILIRITAQNRSASPAALHIIPQVWFRNTWSWEPSTGERPEIRQSDQHVVALQCVHPELGVRRVYAEGRPEVLFTENNTNRRRLYHVPNETPCVKDAFHEYLISHRADAISQEPRGTKAGLHYMFQVAAGGSAQVRLLLTDRETARPFARFDSTFTRRKKEADELYNRVHSRGMSDQQRLVQRQALAGMLWSKQFYYYDVYRWLDGDNPKAPPPPQRLHGRNSTWRGFYADDVMSMPDKWEYPWFAAWDLAFHAIALAMIDIEFAKSQLELLIGEKFMHPNGQLPAYEWHFSDVNPPVQAWAVWRVYNIEKHAHHERGDLAFLERCYHKLLMNFTWWVNRKDREGRNIFEGGFLGLDNISVFDRSRPLPDGGWIEQADATGWMALFCLNLMAIGLELAQKDQVYEHLGAKFFEHFLYISAAINQDVAGGVNMWDQQDGWYYDVVHGRESGADSAHVLGVRSMVGMIPLFAAQVLEERWFENLPHFRHRYEWLLMNRPEFSGGIVCVWTPDGHKCLLSIANEERLRRILSRVLDEKEFLSPFGIRSISRYHLQHPFVLARGEQQWTVNYEPGESTTGLFGGNSNWRGPIWFPTTFMLITALRVYDRFFGDGYRIECPTGSGRMLTLNGVAMEIARRMCGLFLPDENGRRPSMPHPVLATEHCRNLLLFHEYFDGDTGEGLGASHQTGWTGLVAKMLEQRARSGEGENGKKARRHVGTEARKGKGRGDEGGRRGLSRLAAEAGREHRAAD